MSEVSSEAVEAWEKYRDGELWHRNRRQLRKRDFIAGYLAAHQPARVVPFTDEQLSAHDAQVKAEAWDEALYSLWQLADPAFTIAITPDRELITEVGRVQGGGGALLYGTTQRFEAMFGLAGVDDLPPIEGFALTDEQKEDLRRRLGLLTVPE